VFHSFQTALQTNVSKVQTEVGVSLIVYVNNDRIPCLLCDYKTGDKTADSTVRVSPSIWSWLFRMIMANALVNTCHKDYHLVSSRCTELFPFGQDMHDIRLRLFNYS